MRHKLKYFKLSRSGIVLLTKLACFQAAVPSTE